MDKQTLIEDARLRERRARLGGFDEEAEAERYIIEVLTDEQSAQ